MPRMKTPDEDIIPEEFLESVKRLSRDEYEVVEMIQETFLDLDQIVSFLEEAKKFEPRHDDKLKKLIRLLKSKELETEKVLIFTEFADTARYLFRQLTEAGIAGVAQVDSATKGIAPTSFSASRRTTTEPTQPSSVSRARKRSASSSPPMSCPKV